MAVRIFVLLVFTIILASTYMLVNGDFERIYHSYWLHRKKIDAGGGLTQFVKNEHTMRQRESNL